MGANAENQTSCMKFPGAPPLAPVSYAKALRCASLMGQPVLQQPGFASCGNGQTTADTGKRPDFGQQPHGQTHHLGLSAVLLTAIAVHSMVPGPVVTFNTLRNNLFWDDDKTPDSGAAYSIASDISCLPDIPSPGAVDLQIEDGLAFCGEAYSYPSTSRHACIVVGFDSLEDDNSKSIIELFNITLVHRDQFSVYAETLGQADGDNYFNHTITHDWAIREAVDVWQTSVTCMMLVDNPTYA